MSPLDFVSAAMLRGPYWRVSWSPRLLAVAVREADFCSGGGTRRNEGSCGARRVVDGAMIVLVEGSDAYDRVT